MRQLLSRRRLLLALSAATIFLLCLGVCVECVPIEPRLVLRSQKGLWAAGFSPDGRTLATVTLGYTTFSYRGPIQLWDVATGECFALHALSESSVSGGQVMFTSDGRQLLYNGTTIVDLKTGWESRIIPFTEGVGRVLLSPDAKTVVYASEENGRHCLRLWDVDAEQIRATVEGDLPSEPLGGLWSFAPPRELDVFSPDGRLLALGDWFNGTHEITSGRVELRDTANGALVRTLEGFEGHSRDPQFSSDGEFLAVECYREERAGSPGPHFVRVRVFELMTGREVARLENCWGARFVPGRPVLAARCSLGKKQGHSLKLWDTRSWEETASLPAGAGPEYHGWSCPMAGDGGRLVVVQDIELTYPSVLMNYLGVLFGRTDWSVPQNRLAVRFFQTDGGREVARLHVDTAWLNSCMAPDGRALAVMVGGEAEPMEVHLYDVPPRRPIGVCLLYSALAALLFTGVLSCRVGR